MKAEKNEDVEIIPIEPVVETVKETSLEDRVANLENTLSELVGALKASQVQQSTQSINSSGGSGTLNPNILSDLLPALLAPEPQHNPLNELMNNLLVQTLQTNLEITKAVAKKIATG